jgi:hypothetical protein
VSALGDCISFCGGQRRAREGTWHIALKVCWTGYGWLATTWLQLGYTLVTTLAAMDTLYRRGLCFAGICIIYRCGRSDVPYIPFHVP